MTAKPAFPCPEKPRAVEALSADEVDREYDRVSAEVPSGPESAMLSIPVVLAASGISMTRTRREAVLEAKRGSIRFARRRGHAR